MQIKKYLVLGVLFLLPLSMYIFFASGKDNFGRLPVLTENIVEIDKFTSPDTDTIRLQNSITILGFFGNDPLANKVNAYNLAHKIYKKYRGFNDFQIVILQPEGSEEASIALREKLSEIADTNRWRFVYGTSEEIKLRHNFNRRSDSRVIDLNGRNRIIKKITFLYDTKNRSRRRATLQVFGK